MLTTERVEFIVQATLILAAGIAVAAIILIG